ncbi:uncharacterized protein LOC129402035 [Sorex araneus]|uniref:uncharacterized protein LOC129402035 n=1 Tax=Sorex araneus TaxID=42254 RepID=UPI002433F724|nr:uncharacterized protein LOC129402035 [Sorex araneus]
MLRRSWPFRGDSSLSCPLTARRPRSFEAFRFPISLPARGCSRAPPSPAPAAPIAAPPGASPPLHSPPHVPRIRSLQTPAWTLTPGAPNPSQETHPGRGQERGAPPRRSGASVRNPGVAPGGEGAQEAAAKAPAAAAASRARDADSSPAGPRRSRGTRSEAPPLPREEGDTATCAALSAGAARARGAAGGSAAAAALGAFSRRSACEHDDTGRADAAAAGEEVLPGNPDETPRQPAPRVPRRHQGARSAGQEQELCLEDRVLNKASLCGRSRSLLSGSQETSFGVSFGFCSSYQLLSSLDPTLKCSFNEKVEVAVLGMNEVLAFACTFVPGLFKGLLNRCQRPGLGQVLI